MDNHSNNQSPVPVNDQSLGLGGPVTLLEYIRLSDKILIQFGFPGLDKFCNLFATFVREWLGECSRS